MTDNDSQPTHLPTLHASEPECAESEEMSRDETSEPVVAPGMYFERIQADKYLKEGDLVLVTEVTTEKVHYVSGKTGYNQDIDAFLAESLHAPDGLQRRQQEMLHVMQEINEIQTASLGVEAKMLLLRPHVSDAGDIEGATDTAGLPVLAGQAPEALKRQVATFRNEVAKFQQSVAEKQERLQALIQEQQSAIAAKAKAMQAVVQRLEETVWAINLYMGRSETIVQLLKGEPAPADTPIAIRQLVLYADEECAIAAEEGGIDIRSFHEFDEWIQDPDHLRQVLPEQRGVVAFKIRREEKNYGDPWASLALNKENLATYFLMRNGENLYRIQTDLEVGKTLTPKEDEFEDFFFDRGVFGRGERRGPLRPGSEEYMKAMEKADARSRHYQRIALFLQGILDRTTVFQPLPGARINIVDIHGQAKHLRHVADAEESRLLGAARPTFADWQRDLNSRLEVGHRIIGCFSDYVHGLPRSERGRYDERVKPGTARPPSSNAIHTIERQEEDGAFVFLYDRGEAVYREDWRDDSPAKKRASCRVYAYDRFILNFDLAEVQDMEYYLASRLNRHEYAYIFPVLKRAIRLKREEAEQEAPFRQLLTGEILKAHGVQPSEVEVSLDELVRWWKFKNRTHRALLSDDTKAIRMIVVEFALRQQAARALEGLDSESAVRDILVQRPEAIYIGHRKGREFVCLTPENEQNLFVREETWRAERDGRMGLKDERRWSTVDSRLMRWTELHTSERWADWKQGVRQRDVLSDPEVESLMESAWDVARQTRERYWQWRSWSGGEHCFFPLAATLTDDQKLVLFVHDGHVNLEGHETKPHFGRITLGWKRDAKGLPSVEGTEYSGMTYYRPDRPEDNPWRNKKAEPPRVLWSDAGAIERIETELAAYEEAKKSRQVLESAAWRLAAKVQAEMLRRVEEAALQEFLAEYGDPALWEGHKKSLKLHKPHVPRPLTEALMLLIQHEKPTEGQTVAELIEAAAQIADPPTQNRLRGMEGLPLDFVVNLLDSEAG